MSGTHPTPDHQSILDNAWNGVVGGMDWLKSVLFGEFADHRPLSAVVADMLVSFVPGVVIVTSARDAVAVTLRLANHPEKREDLMEWVVLCACLITIALPIAMAVSGAAAAGVGAVVGGIAGTELGAALRAIMLMLIKEASKLVELVRFLQKFIKGDILKFLRAVKFTKYEKALVQALTKIAGKLIQIVKSLRVHLDSLNYFDTLETTIAKLAEWEHKFYAVQNAALKQIPQAMAELDARLAKVLAQTAPKEVHMVPAGVAVERAAPAIPARQRVSDSPGKLLAKVKDEIKPANGRMTNSAAKKPTASSDRTPLVQPQEAPKQTIKDKPEPIEPYTTGTNTRKQSVVEPATETNAVHLDLAGLKRTYAKEIDNVSTFKTFGIDRATADKYLSTPQGQQLLAELSAADPTADMSKIYARAVDQLASGAGVPELVNTSSPLLKIVPQGQTVSPYSPFFTTADDLSAASKSGQSLADYFGLPVKSEAPIYDIYEISPTSSANVFVSEVAPTTELGGLVSRPGGATQYIVPNRGTWSPPVHVGTIRN